MFPISKLILIYWTCITFIFSHEIQTTINLAESQSSNIKTLSSDGNDFGTISSEKTKKTITALNLEELNGQDQNTRESTKLLIGISVSIGIIVILIMIISIILLVNVG